MAERFKAKVAQIAGSNPVWGMDVCLLRVLCAVCCVLSGIGLCDGPILREEESYRLWCVIVLELETSNTRQPWPALGCCARIEQRKGN